MLPSGLTHVEHSLIYPPTSMLTLITTHWVLPGTLAHKVYKHLDLIFSL